MTAIICCCGRVLVNIECRLVCPICKKFGNECKCKSVR